MASRPGSFSLICLPMLSMALMTGMFSFVRTTNIFYDYCCFLNQDFLNETHLEIKKTRRTFFIHEIDSNTSKENINVADILPLYATFVPHNATPTISTFGGVGKVLKYSTTAFRHPSQYM